MRLPRCGHERCTEVTDVGRRFAEALSTKDWDALRALLDDPVVFRGMTPNRFWEAATPADVVDGVLACWFEPEDHIDELLSVETGAVADRHWLRYRVRLHNDAGPQIADQQGYFDLGPDGRIRRMHLMCAGFRPLRT